MFHGRLIKQKRDTLKKHYSNGIDVSSLQMTVMITIDR